LGAGPAGARALRESTVSLVDTIFCGGIFKFLLSFYFYIERRMPKCREHGLLGRRRGTPPIPAKA
jgi:hypothetical protein